MLGAMSSGIEITTSFNPLQWLFFFIQPRVAVNGQEYPLTWGVRFAPFPPGQYHVRIWVPYLFGPSCVAETQVPVYEGHVTGLAYSTPLFVFQTADLSLRGTKPSGT